MKVRLYMAYFCGLCGIATGALVAHNPVMLSIVFSGVAIVIVVVAFITHRPTKKGKE